MIILNTFNYTHHKNCFQQRIPHLNIAELQLILVSQPPSHPLNTKGNNFLMSQLRARTPETAWTLRWLTFVGTGLLGRCGGVAFCFLSDCLRRMTEGSIHGASIFHEIDGFDSVYGSVECPTLLSKKRWGTNLLALKFCLTVGNRSASFSTGTSKLNQGWLTHCFAVNRWAVSTVKHPRIKSLAFSLTSSQYSGGSKE